MMKREFAHALAMYGQRVRVYTEEHPDGEEKKAFVQPMRERGTVQTVPSPLGQVKQDRLLYLGPADTALDETSRVELEGELWRVEHAQPISIGGECTHWWAVLSHRAQEVRR